MTIVEHSDPEYLHSQAERERLIVLAKLYEQYTRALFRDAALETGMRVLDVGCGAGDVSLLAASFVGPAGHVVGVDVGRRGAAGARASRRAGHAAGAVRRGRPAPAEVR